MATQKLHNAGFNCIACQVLIMPNDWPLTGPFIEQIRKTLAATESRPLYYPGTGQRLADFLHQTGISTAAPASANECVIGQRPANSAEGAEGEVFGPALSVTALPAQDAERFLVGAIAYANRELHGTLGANILIHPHTLRRIGRRRFEQIVAELRYGCIAVNAWAGLGFLTPGAPWGAFPGHTLDNVQSGIGFVHNTMLFERPQRTVIEAPFRPFPRGLLSRSWAMLPRPPWFVTNRRAARVGALLTHFQYRPRWSVRSRIFLDALRG